MYFCLFIWAQIPPKIHAKTSAQAKQVGPAHKPPTEISFISPNPIGDSAFGLRFVKILSKQSPIAAARIYPKAIPVMPS